MKIFHANLVLLGVFTLCYFILFYVKFYPYFFNCLFFSLDSFFRLTFFLYFHPSTLDYLRIEFIIFFQCSVWNTNLDCHWIFNIFFTSIFFNFIFQQWVYWWIYFFIFFILLSMKIALSHDLCHMFSMLTLMDSRLLHRFISFYFFIKFGFHSFNCLLFILWILFSKLILFFWISSFNFELLIIGLHNFFIYDNFSLIT